jgi:hypothetical protein
MVANALKGLLELVQDCIRLGKELEAHVNSLLQTSAQPSRWQSVRQGVKIKFNQKKLDSFVQRLETLRNALSFDVVLALKSDIKRNHVATDMKSMGIQEDMKTIVSQIEGSPTLDEQRLSISIQRCFECFWREKAST